MKYHDEFFDFLATLGGIFLLALLVICLLQGGTATIVITTIVTVPCICCFLYAAGRWLIKQLREID